MHNVLQDKQKTEKPTQSNPSPEGFGKTRLGLGHFGKYLRTRQKNGQAKPESLIILLPSHRVVDILKFYTLHIFKNSMYIG